MYLLKLAWENLKHSLEMTTMAFLFSVTHSHNRVVPAIFKNKGSQRALSLSIVYTTNKDSLGGFKYQMTN